MKRVKQYSFFDGETIDDKYVLLGNEKDHIVNSNGLTLKQSLDFMFNSGKAVNYFFRIDYDLNMVFSKEKLKGLTLNFFDGNEVYVHGYKIQYFRNKIFLLKKNKTLKKFFDISNFYKTSFIKTLNILEIKPTERQSNILERYKKLRSDFVFRDILNIIEYNKIECELGIEIVKRIYNLLPENLKTWSLYGASSLTEKFLRQKEIHKINPYKFFNNQIFENSYFGGRMEVLKIGTFNNLWKYDIRSAYPSVIKDLREIKNFKIQKFNNRIKKGNLYEIILNIYDKNLPGLLPIRLKSGYLIFPDYVKGYYYGVELLEVKKYVKKYAVELEIIKEIEITYGNKIFDNNEIENLYNKRKELKAQGNKTEYMIKILLNSIYGKFVQQVGVGKYLNFIYGGYITASTRAELLKASLSDPYGIIFYATDGILSLNKLNVSIGSELGKWEEIKIKKGIVILSGIYKLIDNKNNEINGGRGFKGNVNDIIKEIKKEGVATIKQNIFIGNKYYDKNKFAFKGYRCKFKPIIKKVIPENQIKRNFLMHKFIVNKKYISYILDSETLYQLNKIKKIDFSESDNLIIDNQMDLFS